jgi:protein TonB
MPVIPVATVAAAAVPSANVGDHSSPTPGNNFTTAAGSPTAKAKPDYPKNPEPEYPLQARRRGQEGLVLLNITVSGSGHATEISLKQTSGYELLDQAALKAVQRWQFEPARIGAVGVESKIEVPVRFKLTR